MGSQRIMRLMKLCQWFARPRCQFALAEGTKVTHGLLQKLHTGFQRNGRESSSKLCQTERRSWPRSRPIIERLSFTRELDELSFKRVWSDSIEGYRYSFIADNLLHLLCVHVIVERQGYDHNQPTRDRCFLLERLVCCRQLRGATLPCMLPIGRRPSPPLLPDRTFLTLTA